MCFLIENNNADDFFALISYLSCVRTKLCQLVSKLKAWNSEEGDNFWEKHGLFVHLRKTDNTVLAWPYWYLLQWPWYSWLELGSFTRFCYEVEQKCGHSSFCTSVKYCNFHILCICIHLHQSFMILIIFANSKISQEEYSVWVFFHSNLLSAFVPKTASTQRCEICSIPGLGSFVLFWFLK